MDNKNIGAIWLKKSKSGMTYGSGNIEVNGQKIYFAMFKNTKKEKENQPDYQLVSSEKKQKSPLDGSNIPFEDTEPF